MKANDFFHQDTQTYAKIDYSETKEPNWYNFFLGIQRFIESDTPYSTIKQMLSMAVLIYGKDKVIDEMNRNCFSQLIWIIK